MEALINLITEFYINELGLFGALLVVIIGSFIPPVPDATFFALTTNSFGYVEGFIVSYLGTVIGASLVFYLSSLLKNKTIVKKTIAKHPKLLFYIDKFKNIDFSILSIIIAIPFLPAFAIHVAAGFVGMSYKKFIAALIIGKLSMVLFWTYVGQSIIDGINDWRTLLVLIIIISVVYIISKLISKKLNLEE